MIAPNATVAGEVYIGQGASIWFQCVVRGDVMPIHIGKDSNIQDLCVLHGTYKKSALKIGDRVSVGHGCMLHGCTIEDECLIGMGSVVMDDALIRKNTLVAAGSLVTQGSEFPEGVLLVGRPAVVKRRLTEEEIKFLNQSSKNYLKYKSWYNFTEGGTNEDV